MTTQILNLPPLSGSLTIVNNADWRQTWPFAGSGGAAIDITGIAFEMQIRSADDDTMIVLDLSTANGGLVAGGAAGTLQAIAPYAMTSQIPPGAYLADIVATADGARVNCFPAGPASVTVVAGVTQ